MRGCIKSFLEVQDNCVLSKIFAILDQTLEETGVPERKPPTLDERPLPCNMPTPGIKPWLQWWQARGLPLRYGGPNDRSRDFDSRCRLG